MPIPLILWGIAAAATWLTASAVVALWVRVLRWAEESVLPWLESRFPHLAQDLRLAFVDIHNFSVDKLDEVRKAWRRVREVLLDQTVELVQRSDRTFAVKVTSLLVTAVRQGQRPKVARRVEWVDAGEISDADLERYRKVHGYEPIQMVQTRDAELFGSEGAAGEEK